MGWEEHADKAAALEGRSDEQAWEAAEEYAEAHKDATEQEIADRVGKSQQHISFVLTTLVVRAKPGNEALTFAQAYAKAKGAHVGYNAGENEWYTPAEYVTAARLVMGEIDLDPASTAVANEAIKATEFYGVDDGSLERPWHGRVWMNPPYAQPLIGQFCEHLATEYERGNVVQAITLTNNATETEWFQRLATVAGAMCFPRGRVRFWHPERESAPLQGQAVCFLGGNAEAFFEAFADFGFTT